VIEDEEAAFLLIRILLTIETSQGLEPIRTRKYAQEYHKRNQDTYVIASVKIPAAKGLTNVFSNQVPPSSAFFS
jgi:hypothetical protein